MVVCGPSQVGKTFFVADLLRKQKDLFDKEIDRILWVYGVDQKEFFQKMKNEIETSIEFRADFPTEEISKDNLNKKDEHLCLVIGEELFRENYEYLINIILIYR